MRAGGRRDIRRQPPGIYRRARLSIGNALAVFILVMIVGTVGYMHLGDAEVGRLDALYLMEDAG